MCRFGSLIVVCLLVWSAGALAEEKGVEWRSDYDAARKESNEKNRLIFLDFMTEECLHCRRLDSSTFRDTAVAKLLNERFIPLKIDANRSPKLAQALRIQAYPTMIIASGDGKIIGYLEGFHDAKQLAEHMQRALALHTPDWMARDFQEATKAIAAADYSKAVALLKAILEDGKDTPVQSKARQVLSEIEQQASGRVVRVKQLQDSGQYTEALDLLTELMSRYPGTSSAADGAKLLTKLAERPEIKTNVRARRAQDLLAQAREAFKEEQFHESLDLCEILEKTYKDLPQGKQGVELAEEIRSSPDKLAKACDNLNERLATMYVNLGNTWLKKGDKHQASIYLEKAIHAAPASLVARDAQGTLTGLQQKVPAVPVQYTKPK
jgi:thioredoxin-related protein